MEFAEIIEEAENFAKINCMNFILTYLTNGTWVADSRYKWKRSDRTYIFPRK